MDESGSISTKLMATSAPSQVAMQLPPIGERFQKGILV